VVLALKSAFLASLIFFQGAGAADEKPAEVKKEVPKAAAKPAPAAPAPVVIGGGPAPGAKAAQLRAVPQGAPLQPPPPGGAAAPGLAGLENEFSDSITLPTDRQVKKRLEHAQDDYIKHEEWDKACQLLQSILDGKEDVFVQVPRKEAGSAEKTSWTSAKAEANRLIGTMPANGLQFYEVMYGGKAREILGKAKQQGDPQMLAEVAQRYFHTDAGGEATDLLGTYHLDRGRPMMAALCYERLLKREGAEQLDPLTLIKAMLAFRRVGDEANLEGARPLWKRISAKVSRDGVRIGEEVVGLDRVQKELDRIATVESTNPYGWAMFRGDATRSAKGQGSAPFLEAKWQRSTIPESRPTDSRQKETKSWIEQARPRDAQRSDIFLPAFFPIAAAGKLIYRSHAGVEAVDIKSGELAWSSVEFDASLDKLVNFDAQKKAAFDQWFKAYLQGGDQALLFENSTIGTLSTDNTRVYAVDDLVLPPHPSSPGMQPIGWGGGPPLSGPLLELAQRSRLVAVNLETGKIDWERGDPKPESPFYDQTELAGSYFLGPPLPLGGKLYVLIEQKSELKLVCLDAAKGEPVWRQVLATVRNPMMLDVSRRVHAVHLAYGEGILVCPTNSGAVLGVDLLTHSLVWAFPYRERSVDQGISNPAGAIRKGMNPIRMRPGQDPFAQTHRFRGDWKMSAPIIQDGKVVFTARDGNAIHCLKLRDGDPLWQADRRDDLYLAGVFSGKVVLVGKSTTRALSLAKGQQVWQADTGMPSGLGVASGPHYYLPLKKGEICKIDLEHGTVVAHNPSPKGEIPGNLLFYEGDVISQNEVGVTAYPQLEYRVAQIDEHLKKTPNDPLWLTERGELRLYKGDLVGAIADLRAALANKPSAAVLPKTRLKLYSTLTDLLQKDFPAAEQYLDEYRELCKVSVPESASADERARLEDEELNRRAGYLCLLAKGRAEQGQLTAAFQAYLDFGALSKANKLVPIITEQGVRAQPNVWAQGRITALMGKASPQQRQILEEDIAKRWERISSGKGIDEVRQFVEAFGNLTSTGREARLMLAERLMEQSANVEAEQQLLQLYRHEKDMSIRGRAAEALARLMTRTGDPRDLAYAAFYYRILAKDYAKVVIRDGKTGADLFSELATDKRFFPYLDDTQTQFIDGNVRVEELPITPNPYNPQYQVFEPKGDPGPFFQRHALVWTFSSQGNGMNAFELILLDRDTGAEIWRMPKSSTRAIPNMGGTNNTRYPYFATGHLAVLYLGHTIYAVDLLGKKKLWEKDLYPTSVPCPEPAAQYLLTIDKDAGLQGRNPYGGTENLGQIGPVTSSYVCLRTRDGLSAVDPLTGATLWNKSDVSPQTQIFGDDECVYLVEVRGNQSVGAAQALRCQDGSSVEMPDFTKPYKSRQRVIGGRLLISEGDPATGITLRLYDIRSGKDVWHRQLPANALVLRVEDDELVGVVEPSGKITVTDLRKRQDVLHAAVDDSVYLDKVNDGLLLRDEHYFYVILNRPSEQAVQTGPWPNVMNMRAEKVNGTVFSFNSKSGELKWRLPMPSQMILLERFAELPVVVFTAKNNLPVKNQAGNTRGVIPQTTIICVEKNSGKRVYDNERSIIYGPEKQQQFYALRVDRHSGLVDLVCPSTVLRHWVDISKTGVKADSAPEE
jgi:outer membrane protein assembly factor BamB